MRCLLYAVWRTLTLMLRSGTAYIHWQTGSALVQVMACHLFGSKPLLELMLIYYQMDLREWTLVGFFSQNDAQSTKKMHWKVLFAKCGTLLWVLMCSWNLRTVIQGMGLLPDTQNCRCACAGNAGNIFPVTAGKRSRHASRHVRHARAVMHVGIAN